MVGQWRNIDTVIENRLYLGNLVAARATRTLAERRITHILSVCCDPIPAERHDSGIVHKRIPVEDVDYADLLIHLPEACRFIEEALRIGGVVLVHCGQGLSRGPAVVAAFIMRSRGVRSTQAVEFIRSVREQTWINPGFTEQLVLFELCGYNPSPAHGVYAKWRWGIDANLRAAAARR